MFQFRIEPVVVDLLQVAGLFQSGVLVVDDVNQFFVIANDTQLTSGDVDIIEDDAVKSQFLNLIGEWNLAPD